MTPEMMAVRRRLRDDFAFYTEHCMKIRTKEGKIAPLVLNRPQRILLEAIEKQRLAGQPIRVIVLKARQQGLSTAIGAWLYWWSSQRDAQKAFVVAHKADATRTLFDMTKRFHANVPEILKPHTEYSSRRELVFDKLQSSYAVATAGGDGIGRSETLTCAHLSELAFWPPNAAAENFNGLMQAIPELPSTAVFIESTANGVSGLFAEQWRAACKGETGFIPVFIPWFETPEYAEKAPRGFTRTPDEQTLADRFKLSDAQLFWRRKKVAQHGLEKFQQEYPATPDEAFLTTGRPVFDQQQLADLLLTCPDPIRKLSLNPGATGFEDDARGELLMYEEPTVTGTYYIGADVAMGVRGGDYSVAQVLDAEKNQVAVWRGHVHPDHFASTLDALGRMYAEAKIAVESNNHGLLTCVRLAKDLLYPNFYTEVVKDKTSDRETVKLGFSTNTKTKPMVVDQLRAEMRERKIKPRDRTTLEEMRSFVVTEEGKLEADQGCHDDTVLALAIANHIHEGAWVPLRNEESWYVEPP